MFVLDGSVTLAWCFLDEQEAYALDVLRSLATVSAIVPAIWPLEVTNALIMGERRMRSKEADTAKWLTSIRSLPIEIDVCPVDKTFAFVVPLARGDGLTSYDASYLELAMRRAVPLATLEPRLQQVARKLGVEIYRPASSRRR